MGSTPSPRAGDASARVSWIDTTRGACIFIVVIFHVYIWNIALLGPADSAGTSFVDLIKNSLGRVPIPALFAISGMLAAKTLLGRPSNPAIYVRSGLIAYLYVGWVLMYGLVFWLLDSPEFPHSIESTGELLTQFLYPTTTLWFLWALAVYPILIVALAALRVPGLGVLTIGAGAFLLSGEIGGPLFVPALLQCFVFFAFGVHCSAWLQRRRSLLGFAVLLGCFLGAGILGNVGPDGLTLTFGLCTSLAAIPLMFSVMTVLSRSSTVARWGSALGSRSLDVYLLHAPVLAALWLAMEPRRETLGAWLGSTPALLAFHVATTAAVFAGVFAARRLLALIPGDLLFKPPPPVVRRLTESPR